jgi:hypothetical protein
MTLMPAAAAPPASPLTPTLRCARLSPAAWAAQMAGAWPALGGLGWGLSPGAAGAAGDGIATLSLRVLPPQGPMVDAWLAGAALRRGRSGAVVWQDDGRWAFGSVDIADAETDLEEATRLAYLDVFTALRDVGAPQLLRLWNYLPRINDDAAGGSLERYRRFNIGRQRAFIEAGHDAFEGAPAACALGTHGGGLGIRFLAGRCAPRPLENPRQVPAWRYSTRFGPRSPSFSRGALADAGGGQLALFISGTASIVGEQSLHAATCAPRCRRHCATCRPWWMRRVRSAAPPSRWPTCTAASTCATPATPMRCARSSQPASATSPARRAAPSICTPTSAAANCW